MDKISFLQKITLFLLLVSMAPSVFGQSVKVIFTEKNIYVGDTFIVEVILDTSGKKINALSGSIKTSPSVLALRDVRYGDSILTLWPKTPTIEGGALYFEGGVPGGYSGSGGLIATLSVEATGKGAGRISVEDFKLLLHDGFGTNLEVKEFKDFSVLVLSRPEGVAVKHVVVLGTDTKGPEVFEVSVSRDENVFGNKLFVSFSAVDKFSGLDRYDVEETPFLIGWLPKFRTKVTVMTSPVALNYQIWPSKIKVFAYDKANNVTIVKTQKPADIFILLGVVILVLSISGFVVRSRNKSKSPNA